MPYRLHVSLIHGGDWSLATRSFPRLYVVGASSYVVKPGESTVESIVAYGNDAGEVSEFIRRFRGGGLGNVSKVLYIGQISARCYEVAYLANYDGVLKYVLIGSGAFAVKSMVRGGVKEFIAYFSDRTSAESACGRLKRLNNVDVLGCSVSRVRREPVTNAVALNMVLTPNEFKILKRAYEEGFFSNAKKVRISDLAREFNLSKSTVDHHIRSALRKIIRMHLNSQGDSSRFEDNPS